MVEKISSSINMLSMWCIEWNLDLSFPCTVPGTQRFRVTMVTDRFFWTLQISDFAVDNGHVRYWMVWRESTGGRVNKSQREISLSYWLIRFFDKKVADQMDKFFWTGSFFVDIAFDSRWGFSFNIICSWMMFIDRFRLKDMHTVRFMVGVQTVVTVLVPVIDQFNSWNVLCGTFWESIRLSRRSYVGPSYRLKYLKVPHKRKFHILSSRNRKNFQFISNRSKVIKI